MEQKVIILGGKKVKVLYKLSVWEYAPRLIKFIRKYGWPKKNLFDVFARAFTDVGDEEGIYAVIVFFGKFHLDSKLAGHEAGHVLGYIHTHEADIMHRYPWMRKDDKYNLVYKWEKAFHG